MLERNGWVNSRIVTFVIFPMSGTRANLARVGKPSDIFAPIMTAVDGVIDATLLQLDEVRQATQSVEGAISRLTLLAYLGQLYELRRQVERLGEIE